MDNFQSTGSFANFRPVSEGVKNKILELLQDASQFNSNDLLVDIDKGILIPMRLEDQEFSHAIKSIVSAANKTEKEQGVFPLCNARGIIEWSFKESIIQSPLWLVPCLLKISKVHNKITFIPDEESGFINPFVINRLKKEFDLVPPIHINSLELLIGFLTDKGVDKTDTSFSFVGNFHHHRFEIIKELEELSQIIPSTAISQLLGDEHTSFEFNNSLSNKLLFPADIDQLNVFESIESNHTVVQGPPGTGKSQVLSNLLGKLLLEKRSAIVVSEKRVALEVLQKKLNQFNLGHLCFIATSETISRDIIYELKDSWTKLEQFSSAADSNLQLSEQYFDQLKLQLDLLNRETLIGGISYSKFASFCSNITFSAAPFLSDLPEMNIWLRCRENVQLMFENGIHFYISGIAPAIFKQEYFTQLDQTVRNSLSELDRLSNMFVLDTWLDVQKAMKKAALCQNFSNPSFRKYTAILTPESKEQKKFLRLRKKYLQLQFLQSTLEAEKTNWNYLPSLTETESLLFLLKNTSYIGKWRFKKQWAKTAKISDINAEATLHKWKQYLVNSEFISQIKIDFCEIGVDDLKTDLEYLHQLIHQYSQEDLAEWLAISPDQRSQFAGENQALNSLYTQFRSSFRWEEHTQIKLFLNSILELFPTILHAHLQILSLDESTLRNMKLFANFAAMEAAVCKSNHSKFVGQFPQFSQFKTSDLLKKCHTIIEEQDKESVAFANEILQNQHAQFRAYHYLLQTPSSKLNPGEKELKSTLKKGKSILVKEFSKTRNFPSLRELFASEALLWIQLMKPIWLSNPTQIAKCFPMREIFDMAIFDEASQIPLQNALGTIQRSKRILIAGDQQQMGPSNYFKANSSETVDLLHHASYYWKNVSLKHHYRSENPELIRFSNRHFYHNELIAFPSAKVEQNAIEFYYCEKGVFDERKNQLEAKQVAAHIEQNIKSKDILGIVAFSESQLTEIYSHLSASCKEKLEVRLEDDTVFFKALENVQGEECDRLIISLGYGKNDTGDFHMRFGPLNTKNGTKRLNVLLTRAKKKIDFFASVKSSDFKISSNEAVDLLRLYLLQIESGNAPLLSQEFPYELAPVIEKQTLHFDQIYAKIHNAVDLVTLVRVLEARNWKLQFN